ncbi:hypothetical protein AB0M58_27160 [Streptomyces bobili]|uniref:hypothetical protein n=1 Tax=Streptomyces bobili TaxID=67280 RepID=UPI00341A699A
MQPTRSAGSVPARIQFPGLAPGLHWQTQGSRGYGDYIPFSTVNGDSVTAAWTSTGVDGLTEKYRGV